MKKYAEGGMTPAELAAMRLNKGKSTIDLLKEDKARTIKKKMEMMPPQEPAGIGETRPGVSKSAEDQMMDQATDAGYEYTKKRNFKSGGSVSASKRADGCAVRGKTKGMMR
jgi:hypothetical protein